MTEMASNGTPLDKLTEVDWTTPYGLGKFDNVAEEKLYAWTMDGCHTEETGGGEFPWSALFRQAAVKRERVPALGAGVILTVSTSGGVMSQRYTTAAELDAAWADHEKTYAAWVHSECPAGADCDGESGCVDRW